MEAQAAQRRRQQIERASREWSASLMDVSGRNGLLYFTPTASTLDLDDAAPSALDLLLAGETVALARLFPQGIDRVVATKACKKLYDKQREMSEEMGIGCAYVALGMVT